VDGAPQLLAHGIDTRIRFPRSNFIETNQCNIFGLRGGEVNDQDEDAILDAYVEGLLSGDTSSTKEEPKRHSKKYIRKKKSHALESSTNRIKQGLKESINEIELKDELKNEENGGENVDDDSSTRGNPTDAKDSKASVEIPVQNDHTPDNYVQSIAPPNRLQKYLLSYGFVGRALAAFSVIVTEFIHNYLPDFDHLLVIILPNSSFKSRERLKERGKGGVHSQYAVFTSGSSIGGKKASKKEKKILDQVALDKLKHVKGGVRTGKYAHLSLAFMKKYNLGEKFAKEAKIFETIIAPLEEESEENEGENDEFASEDEDDDDWVIRAFREDILSSGMDLDDINIYSMKTSKSRKPIKVKAGDRESMIGRLRTTGVAGVSSKLMGAYPGDAYAIEDAACKYGVTELAQRYGYGEWTDSDGDDGNRRNRKKQKTKKKNDDSLPSLFPNSKRESRRDYNGFKNNDKFSISFGVGLTNSSSKRKQNHSIPTKRRFHKGMIGTSRRKSSNGTLDDEFGKRSRKIRIEPVSKRKSSSSLSDLRRSFISDNSSVRSPMARTRDKKKNDAEE
jgi:hypothetical protein